MPPFPKPEFIYEYDPAAQISALRQYRDSKPGRAIPPKAADKLLVATWNVANLGVQERREWDYRLLAEVIGWFDVVALQEVNDNLRGLRALRSYLPPSYRLLFSDASGNDERQTFVYDAAKVTLLEKVGEVAIPPSDLRLIKLPGIEQRFEGFDRNPYLAAFSAGVFVFELINVHLYFGSEAKISMNRRTLEAYAVARWGDLRRKSKNAYTRNIIILGDMNLPKAEPGSPMFDALSKRGLILPPHSTKIASSIATDNAYDQIGFFPGEAGQRFTGNMGVFDFDGAVFGDLWQARGREDFLAAVRYYLSDHRPLWAEFGST